MTLLSICLILVITLTAALVALVYLAPGKAVTLALNAMRRQSGLQRHTIELSDGLRIAYLEGGQGMPLLLLHGFGGNKDNFTPVCRHLVKQFRVIIPDIVGFGESSQPPDLDYSPIAQMERIRTFSQALQLRSLHLGGNSMGGQLALLYAASYPHEVESLWLISPAGIWSAPESAVIKNLKRTGNNPLIATNLDEFRAVMALGMLKPPTLPRPMLAVLAQERIHNAELEQTIFQGILSESVEVEIKGLDTPSLIMFGDHDKIISRETAEILKKLLKCSTTTEVHDAGHVAMYEQPQACAREYLLFRDSLVNQ